MEFIPLITIKNRKILEQNNQTEEDFFKVIKEESPVYILDLDGIEKDKPNICTFQKISNKYQLWIDSGPRNLGDVVDSLMSGVESITIRMDLFPQINLSNIREITENKIYTYLNNSYDELTPPKYEDFDGYVNLYEREKIDERIINSLKLNRLYSYENDPLNISYWRNIGVKGLIVNINKIEEFKKYELRN